MFLEQVDVLCYQLLSAVSKSAGSLWNNYTLVYSVGKRWGGKAKENVLYRGIVPSLVVVHRLRDKIEPDMIMTDNKIFLDICSLEVVFAHVQDCSEYLFQAVARVISTYYLSDEFSREKLIATGRVLYMTQGRLYLENVFVLEGHPNNGGEDFDEGRFWGDRNWWVGCLCLRRDQAKTSLGSGKKRTLQIREHFCGLFVRACLNRLSEYC